MDFIARIADQGGAGWLLFAASLPVMGFLGKGWLDEKDKRAADVLQITKDRINESRDMLNMLANVQKSIDTFTTIIDKLR